MAGLQGYVLCKYSHIVSILGKPIKTPAQLAAENRKIRAEWTFTLAGHEVELYDYSTGRKGAPRKNCAWHIGGTSPDVVALVGEMLGKPVWTDAVAYPVGWAREQDCMNKARERSYTHYLSLGRQKCFQHYTRAKIVNRYDDIEGQCKTCPS